jgi:hypothetical protein
MEPIVEAAEKEPGYLKYAVQKIRNHPLGDLTAVFFALFVVLLVIKLATGQSALIPAMVLFGDLNFFLAILTSRD